MIVGCLFLTFLDTMKTQCVSKASSNLTSNCQSTENSFKTMVKTKIFYQKVSVEVTKNNLNKAACKLVSSIFSQSVSLFIHCVKLEAKRDETLLRKPFVELVLLQTNNCISVFFVRAASTNFRVLTHAVWRAGKTKPLITMACRFLCLEKKKKKRVLAEIGRRWCTLLQFRVSSSIS